MKPISKSYSKFKIISIYVTTTVIGVVLIFLAIYNASVELEIIHEIDNLHSITSSRLHQTIEASHGASEAIRIDELISNLSTDEYKVYPYSDNALFTIDGIEITSDDIDDSRSNKRGGYLTDTGSITTWSLISIPQTKQKLLVIHLYKSQGGAELFAVYKSKLIIPAVFFIWMTVWGALILSNLIKQIHLQKEEAEHMARHDALTGLANRNLFTEKLEDLRQYSLRYKHSFCVAVVDLNDFKLINDTYGHDVGDDLLKQVALRFKQILRRNDFVARFGGDEFVLLLPELDIDNYSELFERIYSVLIEPYILSGKSLSIGASLGVSVFPKHAEDPIELVRKADEAMYIAKNQGGGIQVFDESTRI